jgi:phosphoribosylanthranilate isomerase
MAVEALGIGRIGASGLIKVCGLREPEDAVAAAEAGADLLGFVFAPARRRVSAKQAKRCIDAARQAIGAERSLLSVGVFVDAPATEIEETASEAGFDLVQLHGAEAPGFPAGLSLPSIRAFKPRPAVALSETAELIAPHFSTAQPPIALLIDGFHPTSAGGTGSRADWSLARAVSLRWPMLLAGGLTPENVAEAIGSARPSGVDVSSGVERDGTKDPERIAAFVAAAKAAFEMLDARAGSPER